MGSEEQVLWIGRNGHCGYGGTGIVGREEQVLLVERNRRCG